MKIQKLEESDIRSLSELFYQFWGDKSSVQKMRSTFLRLKSNPAYILLTAKQNDTLIGFVMGIICEELYGECKPFMVVEDLIVDQNQRRTGAGSGLMKELERYAANYKCCQVIFVTESNRTGAHQFYKSLDMNLNHIKALKKN